MRERLIDDLLSRDEFSRYYAKVLEVMFTGRWGVIGLLEVRALIYQWLDARRPLNELCTEMLAADGTGEELRAAASFILNRNAEPNLVTRDIGHIFFGRDVQCAQCHDHPLVADYEQSEYFGILSFVNRTYQLTCTTRTIHRSLRLYCVCCRTNWLPVNMTCENSSGKSRDRAPISVPCYFPTFTTGTDRLAESMR